MQYGFGQSENNDTTAWSIQTEDVVVTATYAPTDVKNAIHQVRVLTQDDIQRLQARNLKQLLVTDINVRIEQDPQLGSTVSLQGLDGQNVKIMIDGVPIIGRLNGNLDLSQIQLFDVERVEIVEGPLAVNYGTDALAGVINIITKKSQLDRYTAQLDASIEENGEQTASLGLGVRVTDQLMVRGQIGYDQFLGFDLDSTRSKLWNPKQQKYASASVRYMFSDHHNLRASFQYFDEAIQNFGDVRLPQFDPYAFDEQYLTEKLDYAVHYDGNFNRKWFLNSFLAYNRWNRQKESWRESFDSGEKRYDPLNQDTSSINSVHNRITLATQFEDLPMDFMIGLDNRYEDFNGSRITNPGTSEKGYAYILDNAIFGSIRYRMLEDKLKLETGLRYSFNNRFDTPLLPSFNARYELNDHWTFRGSYATGFRSPEIKELFFNFVDVNHFILGNQDLKPETSNNLQAGFTYYRLHKDQEVTMGFHSFYNHVRDKIELYEYVEEGGERVPAVDTVTNNYTYFNLTEFRTKGVSVRLGYDRPYWRVRATYGLIGYYNVGYKDLDGVRPYSYTNEVSLDGRYTIPYIDVDAQAIFRIYDRRIDFYPFVDDDGNEAVGQRVRDGFTTIDFSVARTFMNGNLRLTAGVRNLLGIRSTKVVGDASGIGNHSTATTIQQVSTGRRWFAGMTYNLGWGK